jgi:hypothetical protein
MYVLIITSENYIYLLYNKKEQDLYTNPEDRDFISLDSIHNDYKFFYNIYSLGQLDNSMILKAEFVHNRLVILYKKIETYLTIYDFRLNRTVHEAKLYHL